MCGLEDFYSINMAILPKLIYAYNAIPTEILIFFKNRTRHADLKFHMEIMVKGSEIAKIILRKEQQIWRPRKS